MDQARPRGVAGHINRERGFGKWLILPNIGESVVHRSRARERSMRQAPAGLTPLADISALPMARARRARRRAERLLSARMGIGGETHPRAAARRHHALGAWRDASSLIGLVPVISMWRAYKIPLPALVSAGSLWHALHAAARPRHGARMPSPAFCSRPGRPARMR